jgi:hypothetical protein
MLDPQLHKLAYPCASVEQHLDHEPVLAGMFISCLDQTLNLGTVEPIHRKRQSNRIFLRECSSDEVGAWSRSNQQEGIGGTGIGRKPISWQPSMKRAD